MQRHLRAHIEREPPGPRRLGPVKVENAGAVERGEVAGFADLRHQRDRHLVAQAKQATVVECAERELAQRWAHHEVALLEIARKNPQLSN